MLHSSSDSLFFDLVIAAQERFYCCLPGITGPKAAAVLEAHLRGLDVRVVVDASEAVERHGYGEVAAVAKLHEAGIEVRELPGNAVGVVVSDNQGYLFFSLSAHLREEGTGLNTLWAEDVLLERLVRVLFPPRSPAEEAKAQERWQIALTSLDQGLMVFTECGPDDQPVSVQKLDEVGLEAAQVSLRAKPPVRPDLMRTLEVYTRKVQFAELVLKGGSFTDRVISLPSDLLGGLPENLRKRTRTTFRLFGDAESRKALSPFADFTQRVEMLRGRLCYVPSRRKHVIRTLDRPGLEADVEKLRGMIAEVARAVRKDLQLAIDRTATQVHEELARIHGDAYRRSGGLFADDPEAVRDHARRKASDAMRTISFPNPVDLLQKVEVRCYFYDLTWEDFSDMQLLEEMQRCGLIETTDAENLRALTAAVAGTRER